MALRAAGSVGSGCRGVAVELCLVGRPGARLERGRWPAWCASARRWSGGEVSIGEKRCCNAEELVGRSLRAPLGAHRAHNLMDVLYAVRGTEGVTAPLACSSRAGSRTSSMCEFHFCDGSASPKSRAPLERSRPL